MSQNPNNPPPLGYGTQLFQWIVENILFLKRRINAISGGGGSGSGMTIGNTVSGADADRILFTDVSGALAQSVLFQYNGTRVLISNDGETLVLSNTAGIESLTISLSAAQCTLYYVDEFLNDTTFKLASGGSTNATMPSGTGILAFQGWVTSLLLNKLSIDGTNAMAATLDMDSNLISNVTTPIADTDAANKAYVDAFVTGLSPKTAVRVATATALPALVYSNGASGVGATLAVIALGILTVDGVNTILGDRILVKNQVAQLQNGIYTVTTAGTAGVAAILTRSTDTDTASELISAYTYTGTEGATLASMGFVQATPATITVGTDPIVWNLFNSNVYSAGTGIRIGSNILYAKLSEGVTGGQSLKGGTASEDTLTIVGSISTDPRTTTAPALIMNTAGALGGSSGAQVFASVLVTVNASGTAGYTGLKLAVTETATGSGTKKLFDLLAGVAGTTSMFSVANTGTISIAAGANLFAPGINTIADASYTLVLTDNNKLIQAPFTTGRNITIPPNASVAFPTEARIDIGAYGSGQITFVAGAGVTIRSSGPGNLKSNGQYNIYSLTKIGTNEWWLVGNLSS